MYSNKLVTEYKNRDKTDAVSWSLIKIQLPFHLAILVLYRKILIK